MAGSLVVHGAAIAVLVFGTAFLSRKPPENIPPSFDVFNYKPTDDNVLTGGNPTVLEPPAEPAAAVLAPAPALPKETPPPSNPEPRPEPKKISKPKVAEPEPPTPVLEPKEQSKQDRPDSFKRPKKKPKTPTPVTEVQPDSAQKKDPAAVTRTEKPKIKVNLESVKRTDSEAVAAKRKAEEELRKAEDARERELAEANAEAERERSRRLANIGNAVGRIQRGISTATTVEMPGIGGPAFANYGLIIRSFFNDLWQPPDTTADDSSTVTAEIVLRRDGTVASATIIKRSGSPALDKSVQTALDRSRSSRLPAFPEGAKEDQRTFRINFNLKAKQQSG